jgi:ABC-type xylose transport system permease subunit
MNVDTKLMQQNPAGSRMSNETFITLFMIGMLLLVFGIAAFTVPNFYLPQNMINLLSNNWFIVIVGIGVTFLLVTGNFDMSVGGVIALTGVLSVYFCQGANVSDNPLANGLGLPYGVAILLALLCAMGVGGLNAFFVARLKVPSIIVTLGTAMLARGIAQVITQGAQRNTSLPDVFGVIGTMAIPATTIKLSVLIMLILVLVAFILKRRRCQAGAPISSAPIPRRRDYQASKSPDTSAPSLSSAPSLPASRGFCWLPSSRPASRTAPWGTSSTRWWWRCWAGSASTAGAAPCWGCLSAPSSCRS